MKRTALKRKTPLRSRKIAPGRAKPRKTRKGAAPKITPLKKRLWALCREITRLRYGNTCYTCGRTGLEGGNWQTGHFLSSSVCSTQLRYDLRNLRPQCYNCNINKSGNWPAYEARLIADNNPEYVEQLKRLNIETTGRQYDILWFQNKIEIYTDLLSELQKGNRGSEVSSEGTMVVRDVLPNPITN